MNTTYQQLLFKWSTLAPYECLATDHHHKFKVKILAAVEKRNSDNAWRLVTSENLAWRLANDQRVVFTQLNFVLLTILHHCAASYYKIDFTFAPQGTTAVICNGLQSQPHPHLAIAALDAYIQLLEF
ncbi:hypothetical protein [Anabaena azotica]|uniref:Uncharacterized protein n=1 Tax=Anabaena azotica FACHB-119 TaxID=947527 RepID=A0ABR8DEN3_9NOST|nr:hypothetical protein [Anabaena azotica]MBD2505099.1 hypothetical protein [Anabaena azotica FACHB-119]